MQLPEIKTRLESIEHGDTRPDFLLAEHCPDGDLSLTSRRGIERATSHPVKHPVPDREIELHPTALFIVHLVAPCDVGSTMRLVLPCDVNDSRISEATLFPALNVLLKLRIRRESRASRDVSRSRCGRKMSRPNT